MTRMGWIIFISIFLKVIGVINASWWATLFPVWCLIVWSIVQGIGKVKECEK